MKVSDNPEIGRLLASKDHDYPFYFDGKSFISIDGLVRLDEIRSDGDYFQVPTFVHPPKITSPAPTESKS